MFGGRLRAGIGQHAGVLCRDSQAIEPDQGLMDFFGFEAMGAELAAELLQLRAGIASPVVLVDKHQNFKHGPNIAQKAWPRGRPHWRCCHAAAVDQPAQIRWYKPPGSRAT